MTIGSNDNCLVMVFGIKQANLTSFDTPSPWDAELQHSITSDGGQAFVADYQIQTTAANITSGAWTLGGDSSASNSAIGIVILPAAAVVAPPSSGGIFVLP
jgi:hypothetical protein